MFTSVVKSIIEKKRFIGLECTPKHYVNKAWEVASVLDNIGLANHGESVLNVGGGATLINAYLASIGFRVTSIDTCERDERLSQYENITARRMGINLKSMQSNFLNASIVSSYDNVFSICVIEHLDSRSDQELFIRKMVSSLKPGGLFQLTFGYGPKATTNPYKSENDVKKFVYNNILDLEIIQPFKFSGLWTISEGHTWGIVAARKPL
jgi:2-polyprenyl-3-methyl-5-hydroxy-6-metoxy-1,4-benzoquinol methylase